VLSTACHQLVVPRTTSYGSRQTVLDGRQPANARIFGYPASRSVHKPHFRSLRLVMRSSCRNSTFNDGRVLCPIALVSRCVRAEKTAAGSHTRVSLM